MEERRLVVLGGGGGVGARLGVRAMKGVPRVLCVLLLAGCATQRDVVIGRARSGYERLGEVRETTTTVTVAPGGTTTQRMERVTTTSAMADLLKSLGGVAIGGAR